MIEEILLIACILLILYFLFGSKKEGIDADNNGKDDRQELADLIANLQKKQSEGVQSYVYDHTKKQDKIIMFYGQNNSTAQVSNDGKLQILVDYGNGNKETYNYLQVYDNQILFTDSNNSKNSAVLQKTTKSMTLTVTSNSKKYTFYPNISDSRNALATYINEYYYTDSNYSDVIQQAKKKLDDLNKGNYQNNQSNYQSNYQGKYQGKYQSNQSDAYNRNDLYVLKSEIVPPVCPVCPTPITINECSKKSKNSNTDNTRNANNTDNANNANNTSNSTNSNNSKILNVNVNKTHIEQKTQPQPSNPFVDSLNSAVKNLEADYSSYQNSYQDAYQKSKEMIQPNIFDQNQNINQRQNQNVNQNVNQNSMLLPVQNYFSNDPTLVTNGSKTTDEPLPLLNSFSSFG